MTTRVRPHLLIGCLIAVLLLLGQGCGGSEPTPPTGSPVAGQPSPTPSPVVIIDRPAVSPELVNQVRRDLSARAGVPEGEILLVQAEEVVWPDTSLGNPQAGQLYAQVLTPGWRLVLKARGKLYEYHTDMKRVVFVRETS